MSIPPKSQCQWHLQLHCSCLNQTWVMLTFWGQCQCFSELNIFLNVIVNSIENRQWSLKIYCTVNSFDFNDNVIGSKTTNLMSIVNVNTSKKSMSMAPSVTLLMSDALYEPRTILKKAQEISLHQGFWNVVYLSIFLQIWTQKLAKKRAAILFVF